MQNAVKLINYFDATQQNVIPLFQRPYTWGAAQWRNLWKDIVSVYEEYATYPQTSHFMGAVVSLPYAAVPAGVSRHLIIDGQQRLTTMSLLLFVLRQYVSERNVGRIQDYLVNRHYSGSPEYLKLLPTQVDRPFYRALMLGEELPSDGNKMQTCLEFFHKQIRKYRDEEQNKLDADRLLDAISNGLRVVVISLDNTDDPYVIFESLNYKGAPLTQADLVRNFVLMRFNPAFNDNGPQEHIYEFVWRPLEQALGDALTDFIRYYLEMPGGYVPVTGVYGALKTKMEEENSPQALEAEIRNMGRLARYYKMFLEPEKSDSPEISQKLANLLELKAKTCYPLLLKIFDRFDRQQLTAEQVLTCLDYVESFIVRRAVCGVPNNSLDQRFLQVCTTFPEDFSTVWLATELAAGTERFRWPVDAEFEFALKTQPQYGRKSTAHLLKCLEKSFGHREQGDLNEVTIEHVMPQQLSEPWIESLGADAKNLHSTLLHSLGNLTLSAYNRELSNSGFQEKRTLLRESNLLLNAWIADQEDWNRNTIEVRAAELASRAKAIWKRPEQTQAAMA